MMIKTLTPMRSKMRVMLIANVFMISIWLLLSITNAMMEMKDGIVLRVIAHHNSYKQYKDFQLPHNNNFVSGLSGTLTWHPENLTQALVLDLAGSNGVDVFHVLLLTLFAILLYIIFSSHKKGRFFSAKQNIGFMFFGFLIGLAGMAEISKSFLVNRYLQHITDGQFALPASDFPWLFYYALSSMFLFLVVIPQKALELQEEQSLTI